MEARGKRKLIFVVSYLIAILSTLIIFGYDIEIFIVGALGVVGVVYLETRNYFIEAEDRSR